MFSLSTFVCINYFTHYYSNMKLEDFENHSGGCPGSDLKWDSIGRKYGFNKHVHWRPTHLVTLGYDERNEMLQAVEKAAHALGRPSKFKGIQLVQRNWFQAKKSNGIYAISYILQPGQKDLQGRINESGKEVVAGGTGWAVEMGIQMDKPVFVFDMNVNTWFIWNHGLDLPARFVKVPPGVTPSLTTKYAGIGTRNPTPAGCRAIEDVYKKTLSKLLNIEKRGKT